MGASVQIAQQIRSRCWICSGLSALASAFGRGVQWPRIAQWLAELDASDVEQWFTKAKPSTRLGDHFAKCVEFVLRFWPALDLGSLQCSQQVLQPPPPPPATETRLEQELLLNLASCSAATAQKYVKKRMKKFLRKQKYGKGGVNTIGEFDFLFRLKNEEEAVQHWEVSVKYLLYVGPWEAFGLETPASAKWSGLSSTITEEEERPEGSSDTFLGFFLGPHVGETLSDRQRRLKKQMELSTKAAARETLEVLMPGEVVQTVTSKALLLGYLFYEPQLWAFLKAGCSDRLENGLNGQHWRGWWLHVEEFEAFATSPPRDESCWYIVPKEEWLSPIVTSQKSKLLQVGELLLLADQVAAEASRKQMPRMRRFMVAEMHAGSNSDWREVSRGFLVEASWPDTRMYSPVGFRFR